MQKENEAVGNGKRDDGMYSIESEKVHDQPVTVMNENKSVRKIWHQRLAHAGCCDIKCMTPKGAVKDMDMSQLLVLKKCSACSQETMTNTQPECCRHVEMRPGEVVHIDVANIDRHSSGEAKYFGTFIDKASGFV